MILDNVGDFGFGMLGLTWRETDPISFETAIEVMHKALEKGAKFWDGGELYGRPDRNSLHLLKAYFDKYPEDAQRVVISIKGCMDFTGGTYTPRGDEEGVRRSVENCVSILGGKKKLDLFECARVDPKVPIEDTMNCLGKMVKEGLIGGIMLSEVSAATIRRAAKVQQIHAVEVEMSLWCTDILDNGVGAACAELNIPIMAYSPLCRGVLGGKFKSASDIPPGLHTHFPKLQADVFDHNMQITKIVDEIAKAKGCTSAQVALNWIRQMSYRTLPDGTKLGKIIPIPGACAVKRVEENFTIVNLTEDEIMTLYNATRNIQVKGERYPPQFIKMCNG